MAKRWNIIIDVDRTAATSLSAQIVEALTDRIRSGLLRPGDALPGTRELALQLCVNRKTVVLVYDELIVQGWLVSHEKRGTFVSPELPVFKQEQRVAAVAQRLSGRLAEPGYAPYGDERPLMTSVGDDATDFSDGAPDTRLIPFEDLSRAFRVALLESARGNRMGYGDPRGLSALRSELATMLRVERGLNAEEDTLCIVRGSQMGIYLLAKILIRAGDRVAMERLSYPPAREAFRACGGLVHSVEQDEFGMIPDDLERVCRSHRIRAIYLTPHHQFPTTVTMPIDRRMRLLALAEQFDFVVIEDDYDHEFHFSHSPMLPMASVDQGGRVIYVGSLSKILAPGLRIGYVMAPASVINRLANEIMLIDRQGNTVTERAAALLLQNGKLKRHIRRALKVYEQRCRSAVQTVQELLGDVVRVMPPSGGLALWVQFSQPQNMATDAVGPGEQRQDPARQSVLR
jgi:GntR family transcriptional regulator/MocR family aminotransferase